MNWEIISIFIDIQNWQTFYLNLSNNNPKKIKINSILMYSGDNDIYRIKIPFLTFYLYLFGSNLNIDNLDLETNIPNIINNSWYNIEITNLSTPANQPLGYLVIYMTFYYD